MTPTPKYLIIGSGPSGCYVVDQLIKQFPSCTCDVIDTLPHPFGLIRTGVAPDHEKIKSLATYFEKILSHESVSFYGNVSFGKDIHLQHIKQFYDAIFICTGSCHDNLLPLPALPDRYCGSKEVVQWYNGYSHLNTMFNPNQLGPSVSLIGMGNVALDIARIFLKSKKDLAPTETPSSCIDLLSQKSINHVHIFARRGPSQAKCTPFELEELLSLDDLAIHINPNELALSKTDLIEHDNHPQIKKKYDLFNSFASKKEGSKHLHLHFYSLIKEVKDRTITFEKTKLEGIPEQQKAIGTGDLFTHQTDYLISCTGYKGNRINDVPFNSQLNIIPNTLGKVQTDLHPHIYVSGWIKRGPSGVIGTNKRDAIETVKTFTDSLPKDFSSKSDDFDLLAYLSSTKKTIFTLDHWKKLDHYETQEGLKAHKKRLKCTHPDDILASVSDVNL
ncbi:hypothetical protein DID78_02025 [Candidatus Marinamargulisbacteria bacterium SCGC AG-343-D04]|nr:hypothetical protein DID78_02025 [Candidatus Marinamargulisbacteria bacterium SCGC AG-343-D04]